MCLIEAMLFPKDIPFLTSFVENEAGIPSGKTYFQEYCRPV